MRLDMGIDLNLNQFRAFYIAASCGSISLAAEKLFISQPAVSMQIKAVEEQIWRTPFNQKEEGTRINRNR